MLLRHDRVFSLYVTATTVRTTTLDDTPAPGHLYIADASEYASPFSLPGPQFIWQVDEPNRHPNGRTTLGHRGQAHPHAAIADTRAHYSQLPHEIRGSFTLDNAIDYAIVSEVAYKANFDLFITTAHAATSPRLPASTRLLAVSPAEAVPIIAHYLRRQHIYLVRPPSVHAWSRPDFYLESITTILPALAMWQPYVMAASCRNAVAAQPGQVESWADTAARRLARALQARDDLIEGDCCTDR